MTATLVGSRLLFRTGEIRSTSAIAYARYDKKRGHTPTLGMTKKGAYAYARYDNSRPLSF